MQRRKVRAPLNWFAWNHYMDQQRMATQQAGSGVSVIIPVYNGAAFIGRAVRSVLEQTCPPLELIVVDDGSTDDTFAVLSEFGTSIKVIRTPNGGVARARNTGIRASAGAFLAFLDADDAWQPEMLEQQLAAFREFPEIGFCCCEFMTLFRDGTEEPYFTSFRNDPDLVFDRPLPGSAVPSLLKKNFVGTTSNVVLRRSVLDQVGLFDEQLRQSEDYDLWLRCAFTTRFLLKSQALVTKYKHDANLTNNWLETTQCHERALLQMCGNPTFPPEYRPLLVPALAAVRLEIGNAHYERGQVFAAFASFLRAFASDKSVPGALAAGAYAARKLVRLLSFGLIRRRSNPG